MTGCAYLLFLLAPETILCSPVHVGNGFVHCAHGTLPVPAPATAELLKGIPFYSRNIQGELCTPTGAAVLKHFVTSFEAMPPMNVAEIGYGMGTKDFAAANCVRVSSANLLPVPTQLHPLMTPCCPSPAISMI